jgi:hypothetical protein
MLFPIEFLDPTTVIAGKEKCSKLLNPRSDLYRHLDALRTRIVKAFPGKVQSPPRMDLHIEMIHKEEVPPQPGCLVKRCALLQGQQIDASPRLMEKMGKALVIPTPAVDGYGDTHITVAWFPEGVSDDALRMMRAF